MRFRGAALKIPGWLKRRAIKSELGKLEEKQPMIRKALAWLTDPAAVGRKRSIAVVCACISVGLRHSGAAIDELCATAALVAESAWCSLNPEAWAVVVDMVNGAVQVIQPGMDLATAAFALIGFIDGARKAKTVERYSFDKQTGRSLQPMRFYDAYSTAAPPADYPR